jgi:hypothetical protein
MAPTFTRRQFIHAGTAAAVAATVSVTTLGCPPTQMTTSVVVFKRSGHGRRVSNAAKSHNANMLYRTAQAAANDPPHPGDNSKVVQRTISGDLFRQLFPTSSKISADLRHDL